MCLQAPAHERGNRTDICGFSRALAGALPPPRRLMQMLELRAHAKAMLQCNHTVTLRCQVNARYQLQPRHFRLKLWTHDHHKTSYKGYSIDSARLVSIVSWTLDRWNYVETTSICVEYELAHLWKHRKYLHSFLLLMYIFSINKYQNVFAPSPWNNLSQCPVQQWRVMSAYNGQSYNARLASRTQPYTISFLDIRYRSYIHDSFDVGLLRNHRVS